MSKPYQWRVGEPCVRFMAKKKIFESDIGKITYVTEVGLWPLGPWDDAFDGMPIRVFGQSYEIDMYSDGGCFRPLHGTDIRKLEEKYPEYIIKTNEVEG